MLSHAQARQVLREVWEKVTGKAPTLPELQFIQAQSLLEGQYGAGFDKLYPAAAPTNNWGAIQCIEHKEPVPGHCFLALDHHPDGTPFHWPYRIYSSPQEGAADMVRLMTVKRPKTWAAMRLGDVVTAAHELYGYYTGIGTQAQGEAQRVKGTMTNAGIVAKALGEKLVLWTDKSAIPGAALAGGGLIFGGLLAFWLLLRK